MSWGYDIENGPQEWFKLFPQASGHRQSPVDINTQTAKRDSDLKENSLRWEYLGSDSRSLENTGHGWKVDIIGSNSLLTGGPLGTNEYRLEQFHCHWGCTDDMGSEHTVDGQSYSGELHFVHWNTTKYKSFSEAAGYPDGLAVLALFLKAGDHHPELEKVTQLLSFVMHKGDRVTLPSGCDPNNFLPNDYTYWTYEGSLTTPPCSESVTWIVLKTPVECSHEQLDAMRNLNCFDIKAECPANEIKGKLVLNYRPPLPLGNRVLREPGEH